MQKEIRLQLQTNSIPVVLTNAQGEVEDFVLSEMVAAKRDTYLDMLSGRMKVDAQGNVGGVAKYTGWQAELLSLCLTRKDGSVVTTNEIQTWPGSVVSQLFTAAQELNRLTKVAEPEPTKNG